MEVIHKPKEVISKIWREGKINPTQYRLFTYVLTAKVDAGTLLHNVVTSEMILLSDGVMQQLAALPGGYEPWMDELIKKHFLVDASLDDKKTVDSLRIAYKSVEQISGTFSYVILPTTHCNARCFYCYECDVQHENMTDETAGKAVDFIATHNAGKPVSISWFGGEPLLGIKQIDRICSALKERGIDFSSTMISNGYLFNEELVRRIKDDWNFKSIQITLDGTEKVYNEIKAYINPCESPFERVITNIGLLLENDIKVTIRLNLGQHNADDLLTLVDGLGARFKNKTGLSVYTKQLFEDCGTLKPRYTTEEWTLLDEKKELIDQQIKTQGFVNEKNHLLALVHKRCMADGDNNFMILPSGKLGKCEHNTSSHFVGTIDEGITDKAEYQSHKDKIAFEECASCPLYPSCIKLKCCEPDRTCNDVLRTMGAKSATRAMVACYEKSLSDDTITTDS